MFICKSNNPCWNPECSYDLWNPGVHNKIDNVAFSAYAKHEQEKEDIIQRIIEAALSGETNLTFDLDDDFSDEDVKYIEEEVYRRLEN